MCNFSPNGLSFFGHHDSPSNLAESRYPRRTLIQRDNVPAFIDMVGQENNSRQNGFLYVVGQGLHVKKPLSQDLDKDVFITPKAK